MALQFQLNLERREADRVFVSVHLAPEGDGAEVQGVALMLVTRGGDRLSNRLLLPIAGVLDRPMTSHVELRALEDLPKAARVVGVAWNPSQQWEATCPADPGTQLEAHLRGRTTIVPSSEAEFEELSCGERTAIAQVFPWLAPCELPPPRVVEPELETATHEEIKSFCNDIGLDREEAEWLEALLDEP